MSKSILSRFYILAFLSFFLASCQNNQFEELIFRSFSDPKDSKAETDSLRNEKGVFLEWENDCGCDQYLLMRSSDSSELDFSCIYSGNDSNFLDSSVQKNERYVYRLDKKRGNKIFEGSSYTYGFSVGVKGDDYENNNSEQQAVPLIHDYNCNLPCVKFETDSYSFIDEDWFSIIVPAMRTAEIVISQKGLQNASAGASTNLCFQIPGHQTENVKEMTGISITNPTYEDKKISFRVFPNTTGLFGQGTFSSFLEYTISLNKIYKYQL